MYYIIFFLAIGAAGMAIANKKAAQEVRQQRWLKYFTYIIFTGVVVLSIFYHFIFWIVLIIVLAAVAELIKLNVVRDKLSALIYVLPFFALIAFGFLLFVKTFHPAVLLFVYFQVLVFDGFCQITGQLFGKHQLAPKISAAKTIEGLIGGWICCIIATLMAASWIEADRTHAIMFGLLTGFSAFCGDMLASWYKRKKGVKDYSNWLPGQGGFIDRFDSFLMTGFFYYLIYRANFITEYFYLK